MSQDFGGDLALGPESFLIIISLVSWWKYVVAHKRSAEEVRESAP
jgi:hypothetical protein